MESQPLLSRAGVVLDRAGITQGALFDLDGRRIYRALAYDTTSVDMHGTRILNGAFRVPNLANFPVILFHDGERFPVGRVVEWNVTELGPIAGMVFADTDEAREAELLVSTGFLNGVSLGFIGWDTETIGDTLTYTDVEVVELSLTPTPSSRNALVSLQRSIRSLTDAAVAIESADENPGEPAETDAATVVTEGSRERLNLLLFRLR